MKVQVIHEVEFDDNMPEEVKREVARVAGSTHTEAWLKRYVDACLQLHHEGALEYRYHELHKLAEKWIANGRAQEGKQLRWAASNLWWATDITGLVATLQRLVNQYLGEGKTDKLKTKMATHCGWLANNLPWGKRKIVTYKDLESLASKLKAADRRAEAETLLQVYKDFPLPQEPMVVATLNAPYQRAHGESTEENPSVLLVMLLEDKK